MRSDDGKHIAKGKGVQREVESEGSRRQKSGLTDRRLNVKSRLYCNLLLPAQSWRSKPLGLACAAGFEELAGVFASSVDMQEGRFCNLGGLS